MRRWMTGLALLAALGPAWAGEIAWGDDLEGALAEARKAGKPVLIDFHADWCGWCRALDEKTYTDPGVQDLASRYVCVKVNTDRHGALAERYKVQGLPTLLLLDPQGRELRRVDGFRGPDLLSQELRKGLAGDKSPSPPPPAETAPGDAGPQQGGMENPLPAMAEAMGKIKDRLESEETGRGTQEEQQKLLRQLEELIQQAEQQGAG